MQQTATLVLLLVLGVTGVRRASGQDSVAVAVRLLLRTGRLPWARWPDFFRYLDQQRWSRERIIAAQEGLSTTRAWLIPCP